MAKKINPVISSVPTIAQYITQVLKPLLFLSRPILNLISKDISWENLF